MAETNPLAIQGPDDGTYTVHFVADAVEPLSRALAKVGRPVNGYAVEAVLQHLAEKGDPGWASALEFDSERDMFCVRCATKRPLVFLLRRFEKRLPDPKAMRRLVRSVPPSMLEDTFGA